MEELLHAETARSASLEASVNHLEASLAESATRVTVLTTQERELLDRTRDLVSSVLLPTVCCLTNYRQERELQLTNGSLNDLQADSDRYQRKAQELEERIQNDDRVEKLEGVLQNTQDRADELEFQLSKTKQVRKLDFSSKLSH